MKLTDIRILGFRSIRDSEWIPIRKLTLLTGENDGGKTSTLNALEIFLNSRSFPHLSDYSKFDDSGNNVQSITIIGRFTLETEEFLKNKQEIEIKREFSNGSNSPFYYKTSVYSDERFRDLSSETVLELKNLARDLTLNVGGKTKDEIIKVIEDSILGSQTEEGWEVLPIPYHDKMPRIKVFESAGSFDPESEINSTLRSTFQNKISSSLYAGKLDEITKLIENDLQNDLEKFKEILYRYCPDISNIAISPQFDFSKGFTTTNFSFTRQGGPSISLDKEGEGRKRKFTLAVYEWRKILLTENVKDNNQIIICFDEPDTHLDYSSQRKVFNQIKEIAECENNFAIICTHSLNLIDRIPITDIIHYELDGNCTKIKRIDSEDPVLADYFLYEIGDNLGLKNSSILYERCFLVVEGFTESSALPILFKLKYGYSMQSAGIRLLNGNGGSGAKLYAKFLNDHDKNVVFMIDNDTKKSPKSRYFTEESLRRDGIDIDRQVYFIGTDEFEDAFSSSLYLAAANKYWKKFDGKSWSINEFADLLNSSDFAENLVKLVRSNTHTDINKEQIGSDLAKSITDHNEIPDTILRCFQSAFDLANSE